MGRTSGLQTGVRGWEMGLAGARVAELAIESRGSMPIMVTAWDIGIERRKISLMNAGVPR